VNWGVITTPGWAPMTIGTASRALSTIFGPALAAASPSTLSTAFGIGGTNNLVSAGPGPFNVAGEINQTGGTFINNID
jgi:hypothetical protein